MWLYILLFGILLPILIKWWQYLEKLWMIRTIPGPSRSLVPTVSNLITLYKMIRMNKDPTSAAFLLQAERVAEFRPFGIVASIFNEKPILIVFKAELVEEVLRSPHFTDKSRGYDFLHSWLGKGLITSSGPLWKRHRRMLTPSFHFSILDEYEVVMNRHSLDVVHAMRGDPSLRRNVDLSVWATTNTIGILIETVMGFESSDPVASRQYIDALNEVAHLFARRFTRPWNVIDMYYYNSAEGKAYRKAVEKVHRFTNQAIEKKIRTFQENPDLLLEEKSSGRRRAFLDMLVAMYLKDGSLSKEEIREETDTFMFAGHDTTGWNIAWTLMQLGHLPHIQDELQKEFREVFGDDRERPITKDDLKQLNYFDRVLKECQRLYPSVPAFSRRCTSHGAKLGPYRIPYDSTVSVALFHLHRDPTVFPDPLTFNPDRFLLENSRGRNAYAFIPFSAGARNCIGQRFAMQELRIFLVNILRNFRLRSLVPLEDLDLAGELILRSKQGLPVDFEPISF